MLTVSFLRQRNLINCHGWLTGRRSNLIRGGNMSKNRNIAEARVMIFPSITTGWGSLPHFTGPALRLQPFGQNKVKMMRSAICVLNISTVQT